MEGSRMILIGEKETFISRVLVKKVIDAGAECCFVPWTIDSINANIESASLITLFIEEKAPGEDLLHYLTDIMDEKNMQMVVVGEQFELQWVVDRMPSEMIYKTFPRPVDNAGFAAAITEYLTKAESGEFKKSILVVDDDPQYLTLVREWLKGTYKVTMANSGLQAIKWLGKNKADLILLDHEMPVTSGPQVLEMLRSEEETRDIPVMFLTGKRDKESVMKVVALKPEGYFLKDIQKDELLEKLQEFFILHKK